jgi:plastocyanin
MVLGATAFSVGVLGCGGDDDDGGPAATTAAPDDGAATPVEGATETFVEVDAADFSFDPDELSVPAGEELTFALSNTGSSPHTLTVYADEDYSEAVAGADTENVPSETVGEFKVTLDAGDYFFRCELHPGQMQGTITAQ